MSKQVDSAAVEADEPAEEVPGASPHQVELSTTTVLRDKVFFAGTVHCKDAEEASRVEEQHARVLADDRGGLVNYEALRTRAVSDTAEDEEESADEDEDGEVDE